MPYDDFNESGAETERDTLRGRHIGTRLRRYALIEKKPIAAALLMLLIAIASELTGPFIAKQIIDVHIAGIEQPWFKVQAAADAAAVAYNGSLWKRADHFSKGEIRGEEARVLQVGRQFVFVPGGIQADGGRALTAEREMIIESRGERQVYSVEVLNRADVFAFYRPEVEGIMRLAWIYLALIAVSALFSWGQHFTLQASANRIIRTMRDEVFAQIQRLPIRYFDQVPAGGIVSRVTNDTEAIKELYVTVLANFVSGALYILAILAALFLLDVRLAVVSLLVIPMLILWIVIYRKFASFYNRKIRSTLGAINGLINESIQGMPVIQAFRREEGTVREFESLNSTYFDYRNKLLRLNSLTSYNLVGTIRNIAFVALIWYFGGTTLSGIGSVVSLGVLYAFVDYINRMFQPVVNIINQLPNLEQALAGAERVFQLIDEEKEENPGPDTAKLQGKLAFENVWFSYREGEPVIRGISFEANPGETVAIVGHTGSGKSTLLNLLFRFYDVDSGRITIGGVDICTVPRQSLRKTMGIVLQDPFLFSGTIASNISFGNPGISREAVEKAIREVGGERFLASLPNGLDELVNEKGSVLSAGERQLIAFARTLVFEPSIFVLDEATSNIDTETESLIQEALEVVSKGRTTIVIAHRLSTVKNANRILVLDRGQIVESGSHDELMALGGTYYRMYRLQTGK